MIDNKKIEETAKQSSEVGEKVTALGYKYK